MKTRVIEVLKDSSLKPAQAFNALFDLYRQHPYPNPMLIRNYSRSGFSNKNLSMLTYDIKKLYDISDKDLRQAVKQPKAKLEVLKPEAPGTLQVDELKAQIGAINLAEANYHKELVPLATAWSDHMGADLKSKKKKDLVAYLETAKAQILEETATTAEVDTEAETGDVDPKEEEEKEEEPTAEKKS